MTTHGPVVVVIRHGQTAWSASGRHTGRTDIPLNETGEAQARALRERLAGREFALVLCSPLVRSVRTAELAGLTGVQLDPDLMEWDYGECEGRTTDEIRQDLPGWTIWDGPVPGGETIDQVAERADRVVARVQALAAATTVALVGHGHILRVLAARWIGDPPQTGRSLALEVGTLSELGWEHETAVIQRWNF
ncbi:MAG: histidine phosphatase family protein [Actinomycetota bacterium]|nr:histidine phosphatase family protein [Actinomycetota bacterium]